MRWAKSSVGDRIESEVEQFRRGSNYEALNIIMLLQEENYQFIEL